MSYDPTGDDRFLTNDRSGRRSEAPVMLGAIASALVFATLAIGSGGGIGWLVAKYGPETAFDPRSAYHDWAARVAVKCPTTTESIRPLLADDRLTGEELGRIRAIAYAARDVCDVPILPDDD